MNYTTFARTWPSPRLSTKCRRFSRTSACPLRSEAKRRREEGANFCKEPLRHFQQQIKLNIATANHPYLQSRTELRRARLTTSDWKHTKAPLAAAIQSMFDVGAQHHSQMLISYESILMREENRSTRRKTLESGWDQLKLSPHASRSQNWTPARSGGRPDRKPLSHPDSPYLAFPPWWVTENYFYFFHFLSIGKNNNKWIQYPDYV